MFFDLSGLSVPMHFQCIVVQLWSLNMDYLIMWVVFACAAFSVADRIGKKRYLWFGIGLLIGPFAVLILGLMSVRSGEKKV